jgi:predicted ATPase/DNA-binding SARP family transcriptional activator
MAASESTPSGLTLTLFGAFTVRVDGSPLPRLRSRKGTWILALLALREGSPVERDWLVGTLWPESAESAALANLRCSLKDLRRALGPAAGRLRSPTPHTLALDLIDAVVDVAAFDRGIRQGDPRSLERAVSLYRGALLEGCSEAWVLQEREIREQAYLGALERLAARCLALGDATAAQSYLRRAVATDPLRESAQRALMQALVASGNDAAALMTYRELRGLLHRELNAEPDPETQALFRQLREEAREKADGVARSEARTGVRRGEFPPLRGLEARPNNLPVQPTPLIGREQELITLQQMLGRAEGRLVTLTGPGGVGKTRLALQVAADLLDAFGDGVVFVDLAPIRDPALVASTVAQTLGVRETGEQSLVASLKRYVREKQLLLVLDNFEQVLQAAPTVAELLGAAPSLKVLVTSRAVLRLRGEQEFAVPPLARPDPRHLPPVAALSQYAAVELFIQRAASARPEFSVTNENAPAVAEICHRLDGLPLAIELAAARARLLTPQAMLARLESRLKLLVGGPRDLPARQQTLRETIGWSYELLTEAEQALFRRLSVFVGGCTLEAAEAVCNAEGELPLPVLDGIASLMEQSLLQQVDGEDVPAGGGGEPRFAMFETIREFGLEQFEASGEAETIRRRHACYFLRLAEERNPGGACFKSLRPDWMDRVKAELDNLRAALRWSHQEPTSRVTEQRLVVALEEFWMVRGFWREREQWIENALARGGPGERGTPSGEVDREQLATWGRLLLNARRYEESIAIWRQLGDKHGYAWALVEWGNKRSVATCAEAVCLFRELGNPWELTYAILALGNAARAEGDFHQARSHYEETLALSRELGDPAMVAWTLSGLGAVAWELGEYDAARSYSEESVAIRREIDEVLLPTTLYFLGQVTYEQGDLAKAEQAFEEALALGRDRALPEFAKDALVGLGQVAWRRGELELARTHGEEGLMIAEELRNKEGLMIAEDPRNKESLAVALLLLGRIAQAQGDSDRARGLLRRSLRLCQERGNRRELAERLETLAAVDQAQGRLARAARLRGATAAMRDTHGPPVAPIDRADREHEVAVLRAALSEEAFVTAWAEGQTMTLHDAVAFALEDDVSSERASERETDIRPQ